MPNCVGGAWATQSITRSRCARDSGSATSCGLPNDRHVGPNGSREPSLAAQLARPCRLASPPFRPDAACHDSAANDSPARTCCSKPLGAGEHPSRQALRRETTARRGRRCPTRRTAGCGPRRKDESAGTLRFDRLACGVQAQPGHQRVVGDDLPGPGSTTDDDSVCGVGLLQSGLPVHPHSIHRSHHGLGAAQRHAPAGKREAPGSSGSLSALVR